MKQNLQESTNNYRLFLIKKPFDMLNECKKFNVYITQYLTFNNESLYCFIQ